MLYDIIVIQAIFEKQKMFIRLDTVDVEGNQRPCTTIKWIDASIIKGLKVGVW